MKSAFSLAALYPPLAVALIAAGIGVLFAEIAAKLGVVDGWVIAAGAAMVFGFVGGTIGNFISSSQFSRDVLAIGMLAGMISGCLAGYLVGSCEWETPSAIPLAIGVGIILGVQGKPALLFLANVGSNMVKKKLGIEDEVKNGNDDQT